MDFQTMALECAPNVHTAAMHALVKTESSFNPYAIGVVGPPLRRQPRSLEEAILAARDLDKKGLNYSVGIAQVNKHNFAHYGLTLERAFNPCTNLSVGAKILEKCYATAFSRFGDEQYSLRAALSCYYSGNFLRGFRPDRPGSTSYVDRVIGNALGSVVRSVPAPAARPAPRLGQGWQSPDAGRQLAQLSR